MSTFGPNVSIDMPVVCVCMYVCRREREREREFRHTCTADLRSKIGFLESKTVLGLFNDSNTNGC